jgi:hypothetical protein
MNWPSHGVAGGSITYWDVFKHEMWRFQIPAQIIAKYVPTLVEYPPMQAGASFNIGGLKERWNKRLPLRRGMRSDRNVDAALPVVAQSRAAHLVGSFTINALLMRSKQGPPVREALPARRR